MEIFTPSLTYQYSPLGEINNAMPSQSIVLPASEAHDAPARFHARFTEYWKTRPDAWARLRDLISELRERLPGNCFVEKNAWLVGLREMPEDIAGQIERAKQREADDARQEADEKRLRESPHVQATGQKYGWSAEKAWGAGDESAWALLRRAGY